MSVREELEELARILRLAYLADGRPCFCELLLVMDEECEVSLSEQGPYDDLKE